MRSFLPVLALITLVALPASAQSAADNDFTGRYKLKAVARGGSECLESNDPNSAVHGGSAFMDDCQNVTGQTWTFEPAGDGYYRLTSEWRGPLGECLEGNGADSPVHDGAAFMDTCRDVTGQLWMPVRERGQQYRLKTQLGGDTMCLEANEAGSSLHGGAAFMDTCQNVTGQLWRFADVDARAAARAGGDSDGGDETIVVDGTEVRTGPIQVTLEWNGDADLDLYVTDPSGQQVNYQNESVPSGGILDVDARADCEDTGSTVENIVWQSAPPAGTYRVLVDHYDACGQAGAVSYTATLRRNGQVVETWTGAVGSDEDEEYTFESE